MAFLVISDRYTTLIFLEIFDKMAAVGYFGVRNSLSIAFLAILDQYGNFCCWNFWQNGWRPGHFGCSKITFDGISGHFRSIGHFICLKFSFDSNSGPFQIDTEFLFFGGHFGCPKITFDRISGHFRSICNLFSLKFLTKWPAAVILDGTTMSIIELVRDIWMSNACDKFQERSLYPSKVIALTTKLWRGGGCVADENIIFPETCVSREYNYVTDSITNTIYDKAVHHRAIRQVI